MTNFDYFGFFKSNQQATMSESTSYTRCNLIKNHFLPSFGSYLISEIHASDINYVYEEAEKNGLSANSVFGLYAALLSFFRDAIDHGLIEENPVSIAPAVRPYRGRR